MKRQGHTIANLQSQINVISAGLCVKVCPVGNIEIKNGQHYFNHSCQRCLACIQYCPKQVFIVKGKAMNKKRYVNPFVSAKEVTDFHHYAANPLIHINNANK